MSATPRRFRGSQTKNTLTTADVARLVDATGPSESDLELAATLVALEAAERASSMSAHDCSQTAARLITVEEALYGASTEGGGLEHGGSSKWCQCEVCSGRDGSRGGICEQAGDARNRKRP